MESNNFISLSREKDKKLLFGIKMIPDKAMNRFTDTLIVCVEKCLNHWDKYCIAFRRKCSNNIFINSYTLSKKDLKSYIDFLQNFMENFNLATGKITAEFDIEGKGTIYLKALHSNFIKISSAKAYDNPAGNLFFVLERAEILSYIHKLKAIYSGREIENYFNLNFSNMHNPETHILTKREKDSLYISTLYLLADNSLDLKDKKAFIMISKELLKAIDASFK